MLATGLACSSDKPAATAPTPATTSGQEQPAPKSVQRHVSLTPAKPSADAEPCNLRTVHFAFDSADLDETSKLEVSSAVDCFRTRGAPARLHLTGATDPRGTEEYNIALGERRASSVRNYMTALGVDAARIGVTSMGEEMAEGTDEEGWARDRNVSGEAENP